MVHSFPFSIHLLDGSFLHSFVPSSIHPSIHSFVVVLVVVVVVRRSSAEALRSNLCGKFVSSFKIVFILCVCGGNIMFFVC
jgi:hypothetical protein